MAERNDPSPQTYVPAAAAPGPDLYDLPACPEEERERLGCRHTLREILQQPETWIETARAVSARAEEWERLLAGCGTVVLTGSGSSEYAGECVRLPLQKASGLQVQTIGSGAVLTNGVTLLPREIPSLMISFARSGDSPESVSALLTAQRVNPGIRHLVLTCNEFGRLTTRFADDADVVVQVLDARTNDQSLVMTSSFTNMVLAALSLCSLGETAEFRRRAGGLSSSCSRVLEMAFAAFPAFLEERFDRAFYLASPLLYGAARESALKMTEMTAGRVITVCETYLGLRHGPMSAVHPDTLVVCFLSADPLTRAYELDLLRELKDKHLGMKMLLVGSGLPREFVGPQDLCLDDPGFDDDDSTAILYVVVGQVLAMLRCLKEGLRPDAPSEDGVINRVVSSFRIYGTEAEEPSVPSRP